GRQRRRAGVQSQDAAGRAGHALSSFGCGHHSAIPGSLRPSPSGAALRNADRRIVRLRLPMNRVSPSPHPSAPLYPFSVPTSFPLPVRNERGEGWGEGHFTADAPAPLQSRRPSSPRPSPPSAGGEGEESDGLNTYPPLGERVPEGRVRGKSGSRPQLTSKFW